MIDDLALKNSYEAEHVLHVKICLYLCRTDIRIVITLDCIAFCFRKASSPRGVGTLFSEELPIHPFTLLFPMCGDSVIIGHKHNIHFPVSLIVQTALLLPLKPSTSMLTLSSQYLR